MIIKPIVHNTMGSLAEVQNSVIGVNGTVYGSGGTFGAVKFGNGNKSTAGYVTNPPNYDPVNGIVFRDVLTTSLTNNVFTMDGWAKQDLDSSSTTPYYFILGKGQTAGNTWDQFAFYKSATPNSYSVKLAQLDTYKCWYNFTFTKSQNEIFHFGIIINKNATNKIRLVINGVELTATSKSPDLVWTMSNSIMFQTGSWWAGTSNSYVDNLKVYGYEKTYFSDRFEERGYWTGAKQSPIYGG